jgi:hypothetical protein
VEKGKRAGGHGQNALRPPLARMQNKEGRGGGRVEVVRVGWPAAIAGEPGHSGGRDVGQNDEDAKGNQFPYLPWAVVVRGGGFPGRWRTGGGVLGGGVAPMFREEEARLMAVRGGAESAAVPL